MLETDTERQPAVRAIGAPRRAEHHSIQIGCASLYNPSIETSFLSAGRGAERELEDPQDPNVRRIYGRMTNALVRSLWQAEVTDLTYRELVELLEYKPHCQGDSLDQPLFSPARGHPLVREFAGWADRDRIRHMIELLRRAIERRDGHDPEGHLNLGIAYGYLKAYDRAVDALNEALVQKKKYREAQYHLGRVLLESGRDPAAAVAQLKEAQADETNVAARYYLGQALRAFVEQDVLVEAEKAFGDYLAGGAPLGQEEEVTAFLESRRAER
jgi:tetratricopeptide (TPR) repeat protein